MTSETLSSSKSWILKEEIEESTKRDLRNHLVEQMRKLRPHKM